MPNQNVDTMHDKKTAAKSRKQPRGRRAQLGGGEDYQLTFTDWLMLNALTRAMNKQGGALRIGLTRDGGALALGVYVDQDYGTEYVRPAEELGEALREIAAAWLKDGAAVYGEELDQVADELEVYVGATRKVTPKTP